MLDCALICTRPILRDSFAPTRPPMPDCDLPCASTDYKMLLQACSTPLSGMG